MSEGNYMPGTRIRYTLQNLGLIGAEGLVNYGDTGTVLGPAPDDSGWIYTEPDEFPQTVCPVDPSMVEALDV